MVKRVAGLETRLPVKSIPGPDVDLMVDPDQIEQMLINLVRNAAEAVLEGLPSKGANEADSPPRNGFQPAVSIGWRCSTKLWP